MLRRSDRPVQVAHPHAARRTLTQSRRGLHQQKSDMRPPIPLSHCAGRMAGFCEIAAAPEGRPSYAGIRSEHRKGIAITPYVRAVNVARRTETRRLKRAARSTTSSWRSPIASSGSSGSPGRSSSRSGSEKRGDAMPPRQPGTRRVSHDVEAPSYARGSNRAWKKRSFSGS
jgi:hypothetical protein